MQKRVYTTRKKIIIRKQQSLDMIHFKDMHVKYHLFGYSLNTDFASKSNNHRNN